MRRDKSRERKIAGERINILMDLAEQETKEGRTKRSERYVQLAKRISMRYNVRFPRALKRKICSKCNSFLIPSVNCRIRLTSRTISIYCFKCDKYTRIPYIKEKKTKRAKNSK